MGSEDAVTAIRDASFSIKALQGFQYVDEKGKDQGINGNMKRYFGRWGAH